jgi:hypothetical protein
MAATLLVFSDPVAGREEDYHSWYSETHLPELLSLPGFVGARRLARADGGVAGFPCCPQGNVAMYELDGDGQHAIAAMMAAAASGELHMSDALDMSSLALWLFRARGEPMTRVAL